MRRIITLNVTHRDGETGPMRGFRFFWAYRVSGFRADRHCQPCFRGSLVNEFSTRTVTSGREVQVDLHPQHRYLYVCGVGSGPKNELRLRNFHFL
jgi:hypothetical protein